MKVRLTCAACGPYMVEATPIPGTPLAAVAPSHERTHTASDIHLYLTMIRQTYRECTTWVQRAA